MLSVVPAHDCADGPVPSVNVTAALAIGPSLPRVALRVVASPSVPAVGPVYVVFVG